MGATIIDGKALAAATKAEAAEKVKELKAQGINPCLAVILVGENPASQVYAVSYTHLDVYKRQGQPDARL